MWYRMCSLSSAPAFIWHSRASRDGDEVTRGRKRRWPSGRSSTSGHLSVHMTLPPLEWRQRPHLTSAKTNTLQGLPFELPVLVRFHARSCTPSAFPRSLFPSFPPLHLPFPCSYVAPSVNYIDSKRCLEPLLANDSLIFRICNNRGPIRKFHITLAT